MSDDKACCAHIHVTLRHLDHPGGTRSDSWACVDCGTRFIPEPRVEWQQPATVGRFEPNEPEPQPQPQPRRTGVFIPLIELEKRMEAAEQTLKDQRSLMAHLEAGLVDRMAALVDRLAKVENKMQGFRDHSERVARLEKSFTDSVEACLKTVQEQVATNMQFAKDIMGIPPKLP